uniref:hypothetical protein n=1 Tax=Prevotella sp. TaxID=59823 RepID=UPI003FED7234
MKKVELDLCFLNIIDQFITTNMQKRLSLSFDWDSHFYFVTSIICLIIADPHHSIFAKPHTSDLLP